MRQALDAHPEVIAEALQTIMRREGIANGHEIIRMETQGNKVTLAGLRSIISNLAVSDETKKQMLALEPHTYTGLAAKLARM